METIEIKSDSVLAILDKALRVSRLQPEYSMQSYIDENTKRMEKGLILANVKGDKLDLLQKFPVENLHKLGILGFVNGEEPGQGSIPLHHVVPKVGDVISLALIEQGVYEGNFKDVLEGKKVKGLQHIMSYTVTEQDLVNSKHIITLLPETLAIQTRS